VVFERFRAAADPLREKGRAVLVCYLDDSGKDPQNLCTTIAGYAATETAWEAFEVDVEPWFKEFGVGVLHAMDLHGTRGDFKGWSVLKKQAFVSRICQARNPHIMLGVSMAAEKAPFEQIRKERGRVRTASAYAWCFNVIVDWLLRDFRTGAAANTEGVAFILERGHENNPDAERAFHAIRDRFEIHDRLKSISFVPKEACRAIQLADLLAFYSRRNNEKLLRAKKEGQEAHPIDTMDRLLVEGAPHRGFVATAFGDKAEGSLFLSGEDP
jgi:hypothetical protein